MESLLSLPRLGTFEMTLDETYSIGDEVVVWLFGEWKKVVVVGVHEDKVLLEDKNEPFVPDTHKSGIWVDRKSSLLRQEAVCCIQ